MLTFKWDEIQRREDGRILLLDRHERIFTEPFMSTTKNVLDVGGWGVLAQRFIESGRACTILDAFTKDQYFPERVRGLPHKEGDVRDKNCFPSKIFDLVTCFETLEHCGDIDLALANIYNWLRPEGWLVGTIPIPGFCHFPDEVGVHLVTEEELTKKIEKAGFKQVHTEPSRSIGSDTPVTCIYFRGAVQSTPIFKHGK